MVQYIPNRHLKRMFPYEFFDELYDELTEYTPDNIAFVLRESSHEIKDKKKEKETFESVRDEMISNKTLEQNNIYKELDQGQFLIIDTYIKRIDKELFLKQQRNEDSGYVARYVLLGQLYDHLQRPIFTTDTGLSTIRSIPEILWDDPNLALVLMEIQPDSRNEDFETTAQLLVIKAPQFFIDDLITRPDIKGADEDEE